MSMDFSRKLPIPKEIKEQFPVDEKIKKTGKLSTIFKEEKLFSKAFDPEQYYRINPQKLGEVNRWVRDKG